MTREPRRDVSHLLAAVKPVLDIVHDALMLVSPAGMLLYANEPAMRATNLYQEGGVGSATNDIFPQIANEIVKVLDTREPRNVQCSDSRGHEIRGTLLPLTLGKRVMVVAFVIQVPGLSDPAPLLEESGNQMAGLLDAVMKSSYDGLWITDNSGKVIRLNKAAERITGCTADDVVGRKFADLVSTGYMDDSVVCEVLERKTTVTIVHTTKQNKKVLATASPILDANGEISLVVINNRDITELNRMSEDLDRSKALVDIYRQQLTESQQGDPDTGCYICNSKIMQSVHEKVLRVSQYDSTVLLTGESGVGKGILASLIHEKSPRRNGPFIRVDCGAIVETLFESEIFGYEKGAFTGAVGEGKPGLVEMADGGTLFFDEIGEVPLSQQVKLLRFLDEKAVVRVGGSKVCPVDTRVIVATNKNLAEEVEQNRFRRDLFYRLNVVSLVIPPLRGRSEDVADLIHFFLKKVGAKLGIYKGIEPEALDALSAYRYPGNVRELEHLIESLLIMSRGDRIALDDLPVDLQCRTAEFYESSTQETSPLPSLISRVETQQILSALEKYGSQREAARHLGINQSTISRKLRKTR